MQVSEPTHHQQPSWKIKNWRIIPKSLTLPLKKQIRTIRTIQLRPSYPQRQPQNLGLPQTYSHCRSLALIRSALQNRAIPLISQHELKLLLHLLRKLITSQNQEKSQNTQRPTRTLQNPIRLQPHQRILHNLLRQSRTTICQSTRRRSHFGVRTTRSTQQ